MHGSTDVEENGNGVSKVSVRTLEELITLNLSTLEDVVSGEIDNKKAALIFTGSRTVIGSLKLGLEAMKLGMTRISGVPIGDNKQLVGE